MLHVFGLARLLSNAEVSEDNVQDLLCSDPSGDPAEAREGLPDALGRQGQVDVPVSLVLSQGRAAALEMGPVARLGQTRGTGHGVGTATGSCRTKPMTSFVCMFIYGL